MRFNNNIATVQIFDNQIDIPFFKEVLIMATTCGTCGYRDNEVKSGTGIADEGTKIELRLTDPSDLSRDILKVIALFFGNKVHILNNVSPKRSKYPEMESLLTNVWDHKRTRKGYLR